MTTSTGGAGAGTPEGGAGGASSVRGGPVDLSGVFNARHTGGLPTADGRRVRDYTIIRSGHLRDLDATGCTELAELQIHSVVDLRETDGSTGTTENPDAACVASVASYYHANLPKLPPSAENYLQTLAAAEPELGAIFGVIGREQGLPAILHCVSGRDRASILTALVLLAVGVPAADVVRDYVENQDAEVLPDVAAEYLQAVIDRVGASGGIEAYLQQHGVSAAELATLRELGTQ